MKRALVYARQSQRNPDQDESVSLAFQERRIRDYCERNGMEVVGVYSDIDVSGNIEARDGLDAMLARCAAGGIDVVAIYNISRLARDTYLFLKITRELTNRKIDLVSASESMEDRTVVTVLSAFAERERTTLSNNVAYAIREQARRGLMTQPPPWGYERRDGEIVVDPVPAAIVRRIFDQYAAGKTSGEIMDELHQRGITSPHGAPRWQRSSITRLLRNRAYVGEIEISETRDPVGRIRPGLVTQGSHEPLVSRETWEAVQARLNGIQAIRRFTSYPAPWLSGFTYCAVCGDRLYVERQASKPERVQPYWLLRCATSRRAHNTKGFSGCTGQSLGVLAPHEQNARLALAHDLSAVFSPEAAMKAHRQSIGEQKHDRSDDLRTIIADCTARLARVYDGYESGKVSLEIYSERSQALERQMQDAETELATIPIMPEIGVYRDAALLMTGFAEDVMDADDDAMRALVTTIGATVAINLRERTVEWRYPEPFHSLVASRMR